MKIEIHRQRKINYLTAFKIHVITMIFFLAMIILKFNTLVAQKDVFIVRIFSENIVYCLYYTHLQIFLHPSFYKEIFLRLNFIKLKKRIQKYRLLYILITLVH